MTTPPYLLPFVLSVPDAEKRRDGNLDVYLPANSGVEMAPAVVFVHGGPIPAELRPTPRDWPVYIGYGSLAASHGVVGVTFDHHLYSTADYPVAASDVASVVERVRALPEVDADRVALWFFSGGGLLAADWISKPPPWLRCLAATYPVLAPPPGSDIEARFNAVEAVRTAGSVPILLTRVGRERAEFAAMVDEFTSEAELHQAPLTVIDVPDGQHGFDTMDHNEGSREAVTKAMTWVVSCLQQ